MAFVSPMLVDEIVVLRSETLTLRVLSHEYSRVAGYHARVGISGVHASAASSCPESGLLERIRRSARSERDCGEARLIALAGESASAGAGPRVGAIVHRYHHSQGVAGEAEARAFHRLTLGLVPLCATRWSSELAMPPTAQCSCTTRTAAVHTQVAYLQREASMRLAHNNFVAVNSTRLRPISDPCSMILNMLHKIIFISQVCIQSCDRFLRFRFGPAPGALRCSAHCAAGSAMLWHRLRH